MLHSGAMPYSSKWLAMQINHVHMYPETGPWSVNLSNILGCWTMSSTLHLAS